MIDLLKKHPRIGSVSDINPKYRKVVVTPQTSLFVHIDGNTVVLITFWDNANDPELIAKLLQ